MNVTDDHAWSTDDHAPLCWGSDKNLDEQMNDDGEDLEKELRAVL